MYIRDQQKFCTVLMIFSVIVRLFCYQPQAAAKEAAIKSDVLTLQILPAAAETKAEKADEPLFAVPDTATEQGEEPAQLTFSDTEADAITIGGACDYEVDKRALLQQESSLDFSGDGPKILIVHTHSSEAYTQSAGYYYDTSDTLRTENPEYSVIRVGTEIADILQQNGIEVLHDTTFNDYPAYSGAYERMRQTIETYLAQYPSIQMVLDIHRDAATDLAGNPISLVTEVSGTRCAQLMLVVGTDEGGLEHPNWQENLANALKLQALLNRSTPGLCRNIDLRTERFNQHETQGSLLVEFGSTGNTLPEALASADLFAQALVKFIGNS